MSKTAFAVLSVFLAALTVCLAQCGHSVKGPTGKERALLRLAEGDTTAARRILEKVDLKKTDDPDLLLLLARLYRSQGTIIGRLRSQQLLEDGLRQFPDNARIRLELGKTYCAQTFYGDAERLFRSALTDEATACDAHYCLALNYFRKWKRNQHFYDELELAAIHFKNATDCAPEELDRLAKYAVCCYCYGDTSMSASICRTLLARDSTVSNAHFLLGILSYRQQQYENSDQFFQKALSLLPDDERLVYTGIELLLPEEERIEFEKTPKTEQERLKRIFWLSIDPDPTTPLNERYLEHIGRTFLADLHYSTSRPFLRGWEQERGKALIKFGWPAQIQRTLAKLTDNIIDGWAEVWTYEGDEGAMELVFVDEFLNGTFAIPKEPMYTDMVLTLFNSPAVSSFEPDVIDLPGAFEVVTFKNNSFSSSVHLTAKVDADSIQKALEIERIDQYIVRGVFFDESWNEHRRFTDTLSGQDLIPSIELDRTWIYALKQFNTPFKRYRVTCALSDLRGATRGIFSGVAGSAKFFNNSLTLSDVLLFRDLKSYPAVPYIERNGNIFVPNPGHSIENGEKLNIYLEIYNLVKHAMSAEYEVSYIIFELSEVPDVGLRGLFSRGLKWITGTKEEKPPFIIQTATRRSTESPAREIMRINVDSLEPGNYLLKVRILDRYSGEVAEAATDFVKTSKTAPRY